jgi:hypothetical protein
MKQSAASSAQQSRPLPGTEKAAMSSYETTLLSGPTFIVAGFLQQGLSQHMQFLYPFGMLMFAA